MSDLKRLAGTTFSRGLNQAASHTIQPEECSVAENFVFKDRAAVVREGIKVFASLPAPVVALKKYYKKTGENFFLGFAGGTLYNSVTSGEFTSVSTVPLSGDIITEVFDDAVYFCDQSGTLKYYNGVTVGEAGLSSPVYEKIISDCEAVTQWGYDGNGYVTEDRNYLHRERGDKSITVYASNPAVAAVFAYGGGALQEINSTIDNADTAYATAYNNKRNSVRDSSGNIHVGYTSLSNALYFPQYAITSNGGSLWATEIIFTSGAELICTPSLAVDRSNNIHATWSDHKSSLYKILYSKKTTTWDTPTVVASSIEPLLYPSMAIDSSNYIHLAWGGQISSTTQIQYCKNTGTWGSIQNITELWGLNQLMPCITANISNIIDIIWYGLPDIGAFAQIKHKRYTTAWENTEELTSGNINSYLPCSEVDGSNNIHVIWAGEVPGLVRRQIRYKKYSQSSWNNALNLTTAGAYAQYNPSITVNRSNDIHVVWYGADENSPLINQIKYRKYELSSWGAIQSLTNETINQWYPVLLGSIHPDISGTIPNRPKDGYSLVWTDNDGAVKYKGSFDLAWDGGPTTPMNFNLNRFASDVSSDNSDTINIYAAPHVKSAVSSLILRFVDYSGLYAVKDLTAMSSWVSCSSDEIAFHMEIPKTNFSTNASFNWGSCNAEITLTPISSNPQRTAQCAIDNIYMTKTPPVVPNSISTMARTAITVIPTLLFVNTLKLAGGTSFLNNGQNEAARKQEMEKKESIPMPDGIYYYKTTFLKESPSGFEMESNPTYQTSGFAISAPVSTYLFLQLTNIPVAPDSFGVTGRRIYRRRSDEPVMRKVSDIADNETINFLDFMHQKDLGHALEEDHWPAPRSKYMLKASNQCMYYFNIVEEGTAYPSRLRKSKPYEPYYAPFEGSFDVAPNDGTEGTGIFEFLGLVHLLKQRSTWSITNDNPSNRHHTIGCVAPKSIAIGKSEVFWLSEEGVIRYNLQFKNISHSLDNQSTYRIQQLLNSIPNAYITNSTGYYWNGYYLLAITTSGTTNNTVLCYDVDNDVWSVFPNINVNCWTAWQGSKDGYRLFYGNNSGLVCEFMTGNYDISSDISSLIKSKDFGIMSPQEAPRKAYLFTENYMSGGNTIEIQPYFDFIGNSSHLESRSISGTYGLVKFDMPQTDAASFYSYGIGGIGRYKINRLDIFGTEKKQR
jgi:hypothetical protein